MTSVNIAVTGVRADLDTGRDAPAVAVLGELDAIIVPFAPYSEPGIFDAL